MSKMKPISMHSLFSKLVCTIALIFGLSFSPAAFADLTLATQSTDFTKGGKQQEDTWLISKGRAQYGSMILLPGEGKVITLFTDQKIFIAAPLFKGPVYPSHQVWVKTGKTEKIAGFDAEQWVQKYKKKPDQISDEVWIGGGAGLGKQYTDVFEGQMALINPIINAVGFDLLKQGLALRYIQYDLEAKPLTTITATKVDTAELDPALFAPPTDYTEKTGR